MANSVDPDQTPRSAASDMGLHWLLRLCLVKYLGLLRYSVVSVHLDIPRRHLFAWRGI